MNRSAEPRFLRLCLCLAAFLSAGMPAHAAAREPSAAQTDEAAADDGLIPPALLEDAQPVYPRRAQDEGVVAVVVVELELDETGRVQAVSVNKPAEAAGYGFDEAAVAAAKNLVFAPARFNGEPTAVRLDYRFRFELPEEAESAAPAQDEGSPAPMEETPAGLSELAGRLLERGTRLPLAGVSVTVFRGHGDDAIGFETQTDARGEFEFKNLPQGQWRVLADPDGYYPVRETEALSTKQRTSVRYYIEKQTYNAYDVVVDAQRVRREVSSSTISAERAARIPGTFGDVLGVVPTFPGVSRTPANSLVIRGAAPEDSSVLLNGSGVPVLHHFGGLRSIMPSGMVESVRYYPGNFSVEYGRLIGGVVDVEIKQLAPKKVGGYADLNIFDAGAYVEAPLGKRVAIAASARRSYIDALLGAGGDSKAVQPRYFDVHTLLSYRPGTAHHIQTLWLFSSDRRSLLSETRPDTPEDLETIRFLRGTAEYHYIPNDKLDNELKVTFGRDRENSELNVSFDETDPFNRTTRYQVQLREALRYRVVDAFAFRVGLDVLFQHINRSVRQPPAIAEGQGLPTDPSAGDVETDVEVIQPVTTRSSGATYAPAGFLELEARPHSSLLLVPGIRVEYFSRTDKVGASPRLTARQGLGERWALVGGVGLFVQEPTFDETDRSLGNPQLGLEKAIHYTVGATYEPRPHLRFGVTGFYKTMYDLVSIVTDEEVPDGQAPTLTNGGSGRAMGVEFTALHEFSHNFYGQASYTLSRAERTDEGARTRRRFDYDQPHIVTLVGSYRLPRNWEVGLRFRYTSGNLFTPLTSAYYDIETQEYRAVPGAPNTARHPGFHQLDLRLDKRWVFKRWMLNAYLDIQNTYNHREKAYAYSPDYRTRRAAEIGLPILPIIGLRGEY
ncbi:MAG: TonB-dependent receptor domain-containing protein [Nannocystales bacterium]